MCAMTTIFIYLIRLYQILISPLLGANCRFYPTCSSYAITAIENWGVTRGLFYAVKRLVKCNPFGTSGHDPVPLSPECPYEKHSESSTQQSDVIYFDRRAALAGEGAHCHCEKQYEMKQSSSLSTWVAALISFARYGTHSSLRGVLGNEATQSNQTRVEDTHPSSGSPHSPTLIRDDGIRRTFR
jgi:putative membrane protein insertion efficiency factor